MATRACTRTPTCAHRADAPVAPAVTDGHTEAPMAQDLPLLERLAGLPAVSVTELVDLLGQASIVARDPLLAGLVAVDEEGEPAVHPLLASVLQHLQQRPEA